MGTRWRPAGARNGHPASEASPRKGLLGLWPIALRLFRAGQDDLTGNPSKFKLFALIPGAKTPPGRPPHSMSTPGSLCRWLSPLPHPTPPLGPPVRLPTAPLLAFHLVPRQPATMLYSIPHQPAPQLLPGLGPTADEDWGPSQCRIHPHLEIYSHCPLLLGVSPQEQP